MQRNGPPRRGGGNPSAGIVPDPEQLVQRMAIPLGQDSRDEYRGFYNFMPGGRIDESHYDMLSPESMYSDYIARREPIKIHGLIDDEGWDGRLWSDVNFLQTIAGDTEVKVEPIDATLGQFGSSAKRQKVLLAEFLQELKNRHNQGKWYMTTQYVDSDEEGEGPETKERDQPRKERSTDMASPSPTTPALSSSSSPDSSSESSDGSDHVSVAEDALPEVDLDFALPPPTDALSPFFPLPTPKLMGGLVLQQCNLWLGNGVDGKSSGLHHDFHDNLYLLLSGRKRFLIWPPNAYRWLEPHGAIRRIHPNGLIEYAIRGQPPLRSDGLTQREYLQWLIRARQRATLEADERAAKMTGEGRTVKALRKGKGRQTHEQAERMALLQVAEAGLALMDAVRCESISDMEESDESVVSTASSDLGAGDELGDAEMGLADADADLDDEDDEDDEIINARAYATWPNRRTGSNEVSSIKHDRDGASPLRKRNRPTHKNESVSPESSPDRPKKDVLRIPSGGLPGGLRGSLKDLEAAYTDSDEEFDADADAGDLMVEAMAADEQLGDAELAEIAELRMRGFTGLAQGTGPLFDPDAEPLLEVASPSSDVVAPFALVQEVHEEGGEEGQSESSGETQDFSGFGDSEEQTWPASHPTGAFAFDGDDGEGSEEGSELDGTAFTGESDALEEGEQALALLEQRANAEINRAQRQPRQQLPISRGRFLASEEEDEFEDEEEAEQQEEIASAPPSFSAIRPQVMHRYFGFHDHPANRRQRRDMRIPGVTPYDRLILPRIGCPQPIEVHLEPGQMLYLPAGWFHEVTSYCDPEDERDGSVSDSNVHMALNYWFHPPATRSIREMRLAKMQQQLARSSSKTAQAMPEMRPPHLSPYDDEEVWDEIRKTVKSRVDAIRGRAAAQFLAAHGGQGAQGASGKVHKSAYYNDEVLQQVAQRHLRPTPTNQAAEQSHESAMPGKRKREE